MLRQLPPPRLGHADRARIVPAGDPAEVEQALGQSGAQRAAEMVAALAPVETGGGEFAALAADRVEVDAEPGEPRGAALGYGEGIRLLAQQTLLHQRVGEAD